MLSLVHNLRQNGPNLAHFSPAELVALTEAELDVGSKQHVQLLAEARGQVAWKGSFAQTTPVLSSSSAWHSRHDSAKPKHLVLVAHMSTEALAACTHYFGSTMGVRVQSGGILAEAEKVDAFVSPANTFGIIDGGIDIVYRDHFGWPSGRPYDAPNPLQLFIDSQYGNEVELPIGDVVVVPTASSPPFLVAAPTMRFPEPILLEPPHNRTVYRASLAVFQAWRECDEIGAMATPMFGTGAGRVPHWVAAAQMWEAFVDAWN